MPAQPKLAVVCYETHFAPCGGIAAVMSRLPEALKKASGLETYIFTPFHHRIEKTSALLESPDLQIMGRIQVALGGSLVEVDLFRMQRDGLNWCFIKPDSSEFFAGYPHPYRAPEGREPVLLRDSLLFGAATAAALRVMDPQAGWTLLLQDWEAAGTAFFLEPNQRAFLTMHNSYDCSLSDDQMGMMGLDPGRFPGHTVLQRAIPVVDVPVFTVSAQFAADLTRDVLQTEILAPHLQHLLAPRLLGVDNGPFVEPAVDPAVLRAIDRGDYGIAAAWKQEQRENFFRALDGLQLGDEITLWGNREEFIRDDAPWFIMAGRDDPRQKGYCVAALAVRSFLERGGRARFLFCPIPGDEGLAGVAFLQRLAQDFPQSILVLPFLFREGFNSALKGSTFGVMPSFYEPFGMANEFCLSGSPAIARATGGLVQQIRPLGDDSPTGLLFREPSGIAGLADDWRGINSAAYSTGASGPDRVQERSGFGLFRAMAGELCFTLRQAAELYEQKPGLYYQMLAEGVRHITENFSWERAAGEYLENLGLPIAEDPPAD